MVSVEGLVCLFVRVVWCADGRAAWMYSSSLIERKKGRPPREGREGGRRRTEAIVRSCLRVFVVSVVCCLFA